MKWLAGLFGSRGTGAHGGVQARAESGDAEAQNTLGEAYDPQSETSIDGIQESDAQAERWYRAAAEQGHAEAQFNLGLLLGTGDAPSALRDAEYWLQKAADQGCEPAKSVLAGLKGIDDAAGSLFGGL